MREILTQGRNGRRETGDAEYVRVGLPNPLGCGRGNLAPTIDTAQPIVPHLAPEGRHVYRTRHAPNILSPRGATCALCLNHGFGGLNGGGNVCLSLQRSDMSIAARHVQSQRSRGAQCGIVAHRGTRRGWVTQPIGRGNLAPTIADISVTGDSILHLAPEGRHVYSTRHAPNIPKPQRGDMCSLSQSRIRRIERRRERLPFAPEERYIAHREPYPTHRARKAPTIATSVTGDSILHLAPEGPCL